MPKIDYYVELASTLYERDRDLRNMQMAFDEMAHLDYDLPATVNELEWVWKVTNTTPYDAYKAGRRVLSGLDERIRVWPKDMTDEGKTWANNMEKVLKWNMARAMSRRVSQREDIVGSALLYDEIVGQIVHLPTQIKSIEKLGGTAKRQKAALRYGPFAVLLRNPKQVHTVYSDYMPEAVLTVVVMKAREIVDFWGDRTAELRDAIEDDPVAAEALHVLYDYCDYDERCVWAVEGDGESIVAGQPAKYVILPPEENPYPFLPWACVVGGSAIDDDVKYQRHGIFFPIWAGNHWDTSNILGTLVVSQAIAEMGTPKRKKTGPAADNIVSDMSEPGGDWIVPQGHDIQDMVERGLDPALREAWDRFLGGMQSSTVPPILMNAQAQPGESFAGYNLRMQSAIGQLLPYKRLGERWYEAAYQLMGLWAHYTGDDLEGYWREKRNAHNYVKIDSEDIDPEHLRIEVELTPDTPTDRLQRINGAMLIAQNLRVPVADVLEELGETDPEGRFEAWMREQFDLTYLGAVLQRIQTEASGDLERMAQMMAQQIMQQAQQQQGMSPEESGAMGAPTQMNPPGLPGIEGQGFNPAVGGMPPAQVNPAATREGQTGRTRLGEAIGGGP